MRVGIAGFGYVGSFLYRELSEHPEYGCEVVFVSGSRAAGQVPDDLLLHDLAQAHARTPDLVVEAAHADVTASYGTALLKYSNYMPLSLTALADSALELALGDVAKENGHHLYVPHGAATGLDTLHECKHLWAAVTVTMRKNPRNLDFAAAPHLRPSQSEHPAVLYDGPTREVCRLFPRNVNAHAAVAIAGIGFDRTRSVLIADPGLDVSVVEIEAHGKGVQLKLERRNPLAGVSGVLTAQSILGSVQRVAPTSSHIVIC